MAQSSAAAVIDLEEYRRRREVRAQAQAHPAPTGFAFSPFYGGIVWVPVWFVA